MGRSLGDLFWRITGDTSQFDKSVKGSKENAKSLSKTIAKEFFDIKASTLMMGLTASAVFIKTIGFLKDSAIAAINAQETFSKFDVVFSQMGSAAESAAMQFKDSFELAEVTAKKMISDTGNILVGFGATQKQALDLSVSVNSLASDLASFTNYTGGAEGASQALTKAMLGERESLKLLGIVIREEDINVKLAAKGQKDLTGNALNLAKAQATLEIAMEQGKNAIGDYARTHDSASNTLKRAKEATTELQVAIGTSLSPSVTLLGSLWGTVATKLAEVIAQRNKLRDAEEAAGTEEDTTDKKILRLQEEAKAIGDRIEKQKQYRASLGEAVIKETEDYLRSINARIKGLQLQAQEEKKANDQRSDAQNLIASWNEANIKADTDELNRKKSIAEEKKAINDEYLAQTEELNWKVTEGIITEIEEREALKVATENQIQSLYDLYVQTGDQSILTSEAMQSAIEKAYLFGEANKKSAADTETSWEDAASAMLEAYQKYSTVAQDLIAAIYKSKIDALDAEMLAEMEAAGVADATAVQSAELELAKAKETGDAETIKAAEVALKKAKIEEKYQKEKAKLEYDAQMTSWKFQLLATTASAAQGVLAAATSAAGAGWPAFLATVPAAIAVASALGAAQIAAVAMSKPVKSFAYGGVVEPNASGSVVRVAENGSGEVLFNTGESGQAFIDQMGSAIAQRLSVPVVLEIDGEKLAAVVVKPINNGRVRLNA